MNNFCYLVPAYIFSDKRLNSSSRLLYSKILGEFGGCSDSNSQLSTELDMSEQSMTRHIRLLKKCGHIDVIKGADGARFLVPNFTSRSLYVTTCNNEHVTTKDVSSLKSKPKRKTEIVNENVIKVFNHWNEKRKEVYSGRGVTTRSAKLTSERESKIKARLNGGKTPEEIIAAIDGCLSSEYHVDNGYIDLSLICRNDEKIEGFIFRGKKTPTFARGSEEYQVD